MAFTSFRFIVFLVLAAAAYFLQPKRCPLVTLFFAVPVGVFSAIYLVEYAKRGNKRVKVVRMTTETLSGIPSIVYGLFGYLMFGVAFHWG